VKLLFFTQYYPPEVGATQTRMHHFARRLVERGHDVTVVTELPNHPRGIVFDGYRGRPVRETVEDGVRVIRVWVYATPRKSALRRLFFYGTYMFDAIAAGLVLARGRYDAVFSTSPPLPVAVAGYVVARLRRRPFVMDVRDIWPAVGVALGELRSRRLIRTAERVERLLYRRAAAITCVTRTFVEDAVRKGADPARVYFLPNGTVPELFSPDRDGTAIRERFGLGGKFVIGFCGNHGVAQGLPEVLEAARLLRDSAAVHFLFVGEGPVKAELQRLQALHGLTNVTLLPEVPIAEIAAYINAADVMLVPLKADPIFAGFIPSKMFDFLACAKPVVLAVDGEARAILEASGGGVYVEPGRPEVLAETVRSLAAEPDRLAEMGRRGRAYVLEHYLRDTQVVRLEQILRSAAQNDRDRQAFL
jgi:colanic acid biosynthesis glycosyl transferase WcaI